MLCCYYLKSCVKDMKNLERYACNITKQSRIKEAMFKMANTKLDFISDINMYQFIEKDMGGGVSYMAYNILYGVIKDNN